MKTQQLFYHIIRAWYGKHITGGFHLTWRPDKLDKDGIQTLWLTSNTEQFKLTIIDGVVHNGAKKLRSESEIAKFLDVECSSTLNNTWLIFSLVSFYQKFYELKDALNYLSVGYDSEKSDAQISIGDEVNGIGVSRFKTNDGRVNLEFFEELANLYNYRELIFKCNYTKIQEDLSLTKFESVLEYVIRAALHDREASIVIEQYLDKWCIEFVTKDDNGNTEVMECECSEENKEDGRFIVNGEEFTSDSFYDILTFPHSSNKIQKLFYDTKNLIALLNSYRFYSSEILIKDFQICNVKVTIDGYLTHGELRTYESEQRPAEYSEENIRAFIKKIINIEG